MFLLRKNVSTSLEGGWGRESCGLKKRIKRTIIPITKIYNRTLEKIEILLQKLKCVYGSLFFALE